MKKYKTLLIFLILVAIWAAFFSSIKFLLWGDLGTTLKTDLQTITGYLSFGGIFAYLIGGALAVTFLKNYYLFIISFLSLLFVSYAYFIGFGTDISLAVILMILGFLYGLWNVVKTVILSIEIKKTGLSDTVLNAIVGIVFVLFLIGGTLLGNILFEQMGRQGYLLIMGMLGATGIFSLYLDYDIQTFKSLLKEGWKKYFKQRKISLQKALKSYIPDLRYICKNYITIMAVSALLWSISTAVSQVSMEYSIDTFGIEASKASYIFLYSAVGAIIGNIISMKMGSKRWFFWMIFSSAFSLLIVLFPFLSLSFTHMSGLAFLLGAFFGIISNLIDSYFVKRIGEEDKKEYGASTYGFILSIALFITMFLTNAIQGYFGYTILMVFLGVFMGGASIILYLKEKS